MAGAGLNDLRHDLRVSSHFEVLGSPLIDVAATEVVSRGLPLAIGAVGCPGNLSAVMPVELVYAQYPRLGATGAFIARSFLRPVAERHRLPDDIRQLRNRLTWWAEQSPADLEAAREELLARAETI